MNIRSCDIVLLCFLCISAGPAGKTTYTTRWAPYFRRILARRMKLLRYCYPFKRYQFRSFETFPRQIFSKMTELQPYCYTKRIVALIPRAVEWDRRLHFKLLLSLASQKWALFKWHTQLHSKYIEWQRNNTVDCLFDYLVSTRSDIIVSCFLAGSVSQKMSLTCMRETQLPVRHTRNFLLLLRRPRIVLQLVTFFQLFEATACSHKKLA